jgi:hypothetical protein
MIERQAMTHLYKVSSSIGIDLRIWGRDPYEAEDEYLSVIRQYPGYAELRAASGRDFIMDVKAVLLRKFMVLCRFYPQPFECHVVDRQEAIEEFARFLGFENARKMFFVSEIMYESLSGGKKLGEYFITVYAWPAADDDWDHKNDIPLKNPKGSDE